MRRFLPSRSAAALRVRSPLVIAGMVFAAGVALSLYLQARIEAEDRILLNRRITVAVNVRVRAIEAATRTYEDCMNALRTLFTYSMQVSPGEFEGAAGALIARYPGIAALEWAPHVPARGRRALESRLEAETGRPFIIKDRISPNHLEPADHHPEYLPIVYIEPLESNLPAQGFNLLSGHSLAELQLARTTGRTTMSPVSSVFLSGESTAGLVVYVPVFDRSLDVAGASEAAFLGVVTGVFRLDRFFADAPGPLGSVGYEFLVIDHTERSADGIIALHRDDDTTQTYELPTLDTFLTPEARRVRLRIWERDWELVFRPTEAWLKTAARRHPWLPLVLGIVSSGAFSLLVHNRLRYTASIEQQVAERTLQLRATQHALEADIHRRIQVEQDLAASEERYRAFVNHSAEAIWRLEVNPPMPLDLSPEEQQEHFRTHAWLAECNHALARMYGFASAAELTGLAVSEFKDLSSGDGRETLEAFIASGYRLEHFECRDIGPEGRPRVFLRSLIGICEEGRLVRAWGMQRDLTQQRQAEAEKAALERKLLETQKLESLGLMAGGIAHDFNNLLTGIMANASLVAHELPADATAQVHLQQVESATLRAAELCQQMLAYSGKGRFLIEPVDFGELIESTVPLLGLSISKSARLHFKLHPRLPAVMADATQMRQIIMNLVINASDAIGSAPGDITLTTGVVHAEASLFKSAALSPTLPEGEYAFIEVRDTGSGMTEETCSRIFDPFFTTKFAGRGLGLAAALGIARGHQGAVFVESTPGAGSCFRVLLPVAAVQPAPTVPPPAVRDDPHQQWTGRILLVDDEESVRFIGAHMLRTFGLEVDIARDGPEALALFDAQPNAYDLVLLDLTMPRMSGEEVLRRLRTQQPGIRVLLMSGYSEQEVLRRLHETPTAFIQKPFSMGAIRQKLRSILDSAIPNPSSR